tara:strand:+ start:398 stop:787 length:390 start_codon:yes stop_codon:yes gene_type:complete
MDETGVNLADNLPSSILAQTEWGLDLNKYKDAIKKLENFVDVDAIKEAAKNNEHTKKYVEKAEKLQDTYEKAKENVEAAKSSARAIEDVELVELEDEEPVEELGPMLDDDVPVLDDTPDDLGALSQQSE